MYIFSTPMKIARWNITETVGMCNTLCKNIFFNSLNSFLCWGELFFVQQILECLNIHEKVCLNRIFFLFGCKIFFQIERI